MHNPLFQGVVESNPERREHILESVGHHQAENHPRQQGKATSLNDIINDDLDQPRRHQFKRRGRHGAEERGDREEAIRPEVVENAQERFHERIARSL